MTKVYKSNFVRLGNRGYVHASDMIPGMLDAVRSWNLENINHLCATFRKIVCCQGVYKLLDADFNQSDYDALFEIECERGSFIIGLEPIERESNVPSIPYNEKALIAQHHINLEQKTVAFYWNDRLPVMKVLIALQKCLLNRLTPNEGVGRWMCCKCDLDWSKITSFTEAEITVALQALLGNYSAKCLISFNQEEVGMLYFTRAKTS